MHPISDPSSRRSSWVSLFSFLEGWEEGESSKSFFFGLPLFFFDGGGGVSSTEETVFLFLLFKSEISSGEVVETITVTLFLIDRVVMIDG